MIYFIEGIIGAGKTTLSEKLRDLYHNKAVIYYEHTPENLLDLTRKAYLSQYEYYCFLQEIMTLGKKHYKEEYMLIVDKVKNQTVDFYNGKLVSYLWIYSANNEINKRIDALKDKEICNGNVKYHQYLQFVQCVWKAFLNTPRNDYEIFEGVLLNNLLLDFIAFYYRDYNSSVGFYNTIFKQLSATDYQIIYIRCHDIEKTLTEAIKEREVNNPRWIENFIKWVEKSPYGIEKNLSGFSGVIEFCGQLQKAQIGILESTACSYSIIERF